MGILTERLGCPDHILGGGGLIFVTEKRRREDFGARMCVVFGDCCCMS